VLPAVSTSATLMTRWMLPGIALLLSKDCVGHEGTSFFQALKDTWGRVALEMIILVLYSSTVCAS